VVQPGDSLSEIAIRYHTTVATLLALNPEIDTASIIYPGQEINLPENTQPVRPWVGISDTEVNPGQRLTLHALNFPANANVDVRLLDQDGNWQALMDARTDQNGELNTTVQIPDNLLADRGWRIVVVTTERSVISRAVSQSIIID
jgi:hypothetical protein